MVQKRTQFNTTIDEDLATNFKVQAAGENRKLYLVVEDALRLYLRSIKFPNKAESDATRSLS